MGVFNPEIRSMTWEEDYLNANAGSPIDGTWYKVADYAGQGILMAVGIYGATALGWSFLSRAAVVASLRASSKWRSSPLKQPLVAAPIFISTSPPAKMV